MADLVKVEDLLPESGEIEAGKKKVKQECTVILNKLLKENDSNKLKDLTSLFNQNQNKKTMVRLNKLNDLMDLLTDETAARLTKKPDEISNKELLEGLKTVSDLIDKGQKQITEAPAAPLIQINQQSNDINIDGKSSLTKESRDRVSSVVMGLINGIKSSTEAEVEEAKTSEEIDKAIDEENKNIIKEVFGDESGIED